MRKGFSGTTPSATATARTHQDRLHRDPVVEPAPAVELHRHGQFPAGGLAGPRWLRSGQRRDLASRNGLAYGWNAPVDTRERNAIADQREDTLAVMQAAGNPDATWEIQVPPGTYQVHVVCGDPSFFDGRFDLLVEGVVAVTGLASSNAPFRDGTVTVQVGDGRLSVSNGSGSYNTKICCIEIEQMPTGAG